MQTAAELALGVWPDESTDEWEVYLRRKSGGFPSWRLRRLIAMTGSPRLVDLGTRGIL